MFTRAGNGLFPAERLGGRMIIQAMLSKVVPCVGGNS